MQIEDLQRIVNKYKSSSTICQKECDRLQEYIDERKLPKNLNELEDVLKAIAFIESNQSELYIRELSMKVYGDSKYFETMTLQSVCNMLRKYLQKNPQKDEKIDEILSEYHIVKEPQKICLKGKAIINISGEEVDIGGFSEGVEFQTTDLENISSIKLMTSKFMTIENRTSYLRYYEDDTVVFYLGGYANRFQRDFIKKVYATNQDVNYLHFGDIDAGGFWIHHNLCEVTGVDFELFGMSVAELTNEKFASCLHDLSDEDRNRLQELKTIDVYKEVVQYMLVNGVKLEQEIVSLERMN